MTLAITDYYYRKGSRSWSFTDGVEIVVTTMGWEIRDPRRKENFATTTRFLSKILLNHAYSSYWQTIRDFRKMSRGERNRLRLHKLMAATPTERLHTGYEKDTGSFVMQGTTVAEHGETWTHWEFIANPDPQVLEQHVDPSYLERHSSYRGPGRAFTHPGYAFTISDTEVLITVNGGLDI